MDEDINVNELGNGIVVPDAVISEIVKYSTLGLINGTVSAGNITDDADAKLTTDPDAINDPVIWTSFEEVMVVPRSFHSPPPPPAALAIVIWFALFLVNVIFEPSVKFTVESVPEAASNFKGTDVPLLASACRVYVSPPPPPVL